MLLTDKLIDDLHGFRIGMMRMLAENSGQPEDEGREMGGGFVSFRGEESPGNQAYGVGHRDAPFDLQEVDDFYRGRATNWELIVTPFASPEVLRTAVKMGYVPDHFESVMVQTVGDIVHQASPEIQIERVEDDLDLWLKVSESGWTDASDLPEQVSEMTQTMGGRRQMWRYLARLNGEPAATAALIAQGGMFMMAGASTRPQFRGRGLQNALTQRRLRDAGSGSIVQVVTLPGSQSHRNAQRSGFQPLYSKLVLMRNS